MDLYPQNYQNWTWQLMQNILLISRPKRGCKRVTLQFIKWVYVVYAGPVLHDDVFLTII